MKNVSFCEDFCEYIPKHYMPYNVAIWNFMIIGERKNNGIIRIMQLLKSHFKNVKHTIYVSGKNCKNHKVGRLKF